MQVVSTRPDSNIGRERESGIKWRALIGHSINIKVDHASNLRHCNVMPAGRQWIRAIDLLLAATGGNRDGEANRATPGLRREKHVADGVVAEVK